MDYLTAKLLRKKHLYLVIFLPLILVSQAITIVSANAKPAINLIDDGGRKWLKTEGFESIRAPIGVVGLPPITSKPSNETGTLLRVEPSWVILDPATMALTVTYPDRSTGVEVTKAWNQMTNEEVRRLLPNKSTEISIGTEDISGTVSYLITSTTGSKGKYKVVMDYTSYRVEEAINDSGMTLGQAKVGVGFRLTADLKTYKANVNLSSIENLGLAAKANKIKGSMKIVIIGVNPKNENGIIIEAKEINEKSVSDVMQTLNILKSKMSDVDTHLEPHLLSIKPSTFWIEPEEVAQVINVPWYKKKFGIISPSIP